MLEFLKSNIALTISIISLLVSSVIIVKGWQKNRSIYDVEVYELFSHRGESHRNEEISRKLNSGNYMILHTEKNSSQNFGMGPSYNILLARIKK